MRKEIQVWGEEYGQREYRDKEEEYGEYGEGGGEHGEGGHGIEERNMRQGNVGVGKWNMGREIWVCKRRT